MEFTPLNSGEINISLKKDNKLIPWKEIAGRLGYANVNEMITNHKKSKKWKEYSKIFLVCFVNLIEQHDSILIIENGVIIKKTTLFFSDDLNFDDLSSK